MRIGKPAFTTINGAPGRGKSRQPQKQWDPWKEIKIRLVFLGIVLLLVLLNGLFQLTELRGSDASETAHASSSRLVAP